MKDVINKRIYNSYFPKNNARAIDLFIYEMVNIQIDFICKLIYKNIKDTISKSYKRKLAKILAFKLYDFLGACIECQLGCLFNKTEKANDLFENSLFKENIFTNKSLPKKVKSKKKIDFFTIEIGLQCAECLYEKLKEKYEEDFCDFLYDQIINQSVHFVKTQCDKCHISCLEDPCEDNFICPDCLKGKNVDCPYDNDRRKHIRKMKSGKKNNNIVKCKKV